MNPRPHSVKVTFGFIILNIIIWFALGVIIAFDLHPAMPDQLFFKGIMATLSFVAAGALLVTFVFLQKHNHVAYYLMLIGLGVAMLLAIFDDFGLVDLAALALCFIPFILLLKERQWYLHRQVR
jgi:lysylphosphatidylglycerol synthetase-like protein (DUF2156 family)